MSVANFYAISKLYYPATGTFFTPVGELGMALHEMWEVSALPMGSLPYEEYFTYEAELTLLEKQKPTLFETYWELMCHFYICSSMHMSHKGASSSSKSWGNYLFPNLKDAPEAAHCGVTDEDIFRRMQEHSQGDMILEEDDGIYEKVTFSGVSITSSSIDVPEGTFGRFFIGLVEEVCGAISF